MNKKGMTLVEIIISITLVSIILLFLINLLITVKNTSDNSQTASNLLINQALITKEIEKDIIDYKLIGISNCTSADIGLSGKDRIIPQNATNIYCLKLTFDNTSTYNIGYILQYTYNEVGNPKNVVGYKRGTNQVMREEDFSMDPSKIKGKVTSSCTSSASATSKCSLKIVLPVKDHKDNDYNIEVSYIYTKGDLTYTTGNIYGFNIS